MHKKLPRPRPKCVVSAHWARFAAPSARRAALHCAHRRSGHYSLATSRLSRRFAEKRRPRGGTAGQQSARQSITTSGWPSSGKGACGTPSVAGTLSANYPLLLFIDVLFLARDLRDGFARIEPDVCVGVILRRDREGVDRFDCV